MRTQDESCSEAKSIERFLYSQFLVASMVDPIRSLVESILVRLQAYFDEGCVDEVTLNASVRMASQACDEGHRYHAMGWIKTAFAMLTTSHRMHEEVRHTFLFGCSQQDHMKHSCASPLQFRNSQCYWHCQERKIVQHFDTALMICHCHSRHP